MALCSTLNGITLDCRDNVGGIEAVYIAAASGSIVATPTAGAVAIGSISIDGGTGTTLDSDFQTYECVKQTGAMNETGTFSEENGTVFYTNVASVVFNKTTAAKLVELNELAKSNKLCVIVKDNNGLYWMVGNDSGALVSNSTAGTGTAFGDRNGVTMEFTGIHELPMIQVTVS